MKNDNYSILIVSVVLILYLYAFKPYLLLVSVSLWVRIPTGQIFV